MPRRKGWSARCARVPHGAAWVRRAGANRCARAARRASRARVLRSGRDTHLGEMNSAAPLPKLAASQLSSGQSLMYASTVPLITAARQRAGSASRTPLDPFPISDSGRLNASAARRCASAYPLSTHSCDGDCSWLRLRISFAASSPNVSLDATMPVKAVRDRMVNTVQKTVSTRPRSVRGVMSPAARARGRRVAFGGAQAGAKPHRSRTC